MNAKLKLNLYVIESNQSIKDDLMKIQEKLHSEINCKSEIEIIDLNDAPEQAEEMQIVAIPTLIKEPAPTVRLVGRLDNIDHIVEILSNGK